MSRITTKMVDYIIDQINTKECRPLKPWVRDENDKLRAQIGNLHLYRCLGVWALHEMSNEGGGVRVPYSADNARELYAYLKGRLG